eukprot:m51a1_g1464 hypothetical protein (432) ;mRNA; r:230679-231974
MGWSTVSPAGPATGGEGAPSSMTFIVKNRAQFVAAVTKQGKKIVYVSGTINGDDLGNGQVADMAYFKAKTGYDFDAYLKSPKSMSAQRQAVLKAQGSLMIVDVTSDTSIIGLGTDAKIQQMNLRLKRATNVIIRNIEFEAPRDYATAYSSSDGWNAEYDSITVEGSSRLWFDHLTMGDGRYSDSKAAIYKGRFIQWHDGLLDIKRGSDFITVSNCVFYDHDKTNLVGASDNMGNLDAGHLTITFYKNMWNGVVSRAPRVRFGKVHLLGNYYRASNVTMYFVGMGCKCSILSEGNVFEAPNDKTIIGHFKGTTLKDSGSWFNGVTYSSTVQTLAGSSSIGWSPAYKYSVPINVAAAKSDVLANAGAGKLKIAADGGVNVTMTIPDVGTTLATNSDYQNDPEDTDGNDNSPTNSAPAAACVSLMFAVLLSLVQ